MRLKILWALLPAAALAFGTPVSAKPDDGQQKELEQARKELQQAREELKRAAQEMARVMREMGHDSPRAHAFEFLANSDRAVLGVSIVPGPEKNGEVRGVLVTAVTPGSGADKAGVKSGDLLLAANGKPLAAKTGEHPGSERKLLEIMSGLKSGDEVKLDYEREGRRAAVTVIAGRGGAMMQFDDDDENDIILPPGPRMRIRMGEQSDWNITALDPDLAPYFKASEGVLVIKAPKDSKLGLKGGDVIQKMNDDAVKDPRDLMRKLRELGPGAEIKVDIVRNGKSETLKGTLPESKHKAMRKRIEIESDGGES